MAAIDVIVRSCREPVTIDEIARTVGVSKDHLIRMFRDTFGPTAGAYYTGLRIAVACRLLRDTDEKMDAASRDTLLPHFPVFSSWMQSP